MVKAKVTRTDGSVLEIEGTAEEVAAVLAWEARPAPTSVHFVIPAQPMPSPQLPVFQKGIYIPDICEPSTTGPLPADKHVVICAAPPAPAP